MSSSRIPPLSGGIHLNTLSDIPGPAQKALGDLGYFKTPKYGATRYPDMPMFDAIKSFQKSRGLAVDGVMKPNGPTATELGRVMAEGTANPKAHGIVAGEWDHLREVMGRRQLPTASTTIGRPLPTKPPTPRNFLEAAARVRTSPFKDSIGEPLPPRPGADPKPKPPKIGDQVALGPAAAVLSLILGTAGRAALPRFLQQAVQATAGGVATAATGALKGDTPEAPSSDQKKTPLLAKRTDIATPPPPTPPSEPQDGPSPTKTEFPAKPPFKPIDLSRPIPETQEPTIFVHPLPPEELTGPQIIERKGNEKTRKELEGFRDHFEGIGWEHIGGGRYSAKHPLVLVGDKKVGEEQKEFYLAGPGIGRQGANYLDLTFRKPDGRIVHVQTVDVDRNGNVTQWELDAAFRVWRGSENTDVILIPKGAQLDKIFNSRK